MLKKIISIFAVIIILLGLYFFISHSPTLPAPQAQTESSQPEKISISPDLPQPTLPLSNDPKDVAWDLFQKYLTYNKNRNLAGVQSLVYKIAPVCADPKTRIDCEARMAAAYDYGSKLRKPDFVNVWSDDHQTILATDFWIEDSPDLDMLGRFRSIIFFVKDTKGDLKLLSFSPTKGGATSKGTASQEELEQRVKIWSEDQDQDGIADYEEQCLGSQDSACIKTDPKKRDTDGDGYWDGVDKLLNN